MLTSAKLVTSQVRKNEQRAHLKVAFGIFKDFFVAKSIRSTSLAHIEWDIFPQNKLFVPRAHPTIFSHFLPNKQNLKLKVIETNFKSIPRNSISWL